MKAFLFMTWVMSFLSMTLGHEFPFYGIGPFLFDFMHHVLASGELSWRFGLLCVIA